MCVHLCVGHLYLWECYGFVRLCDAKGVSEACVCVCVCLSQVGVHVGVRGERDVTARLGTRVSGGKAAHRCVRAFMQSPSCTSTCPSHPSPHSSSSRSLSPVSEVSSQKGWVGAVLSPPPPPLEV